MEDNKDNKDNKKDKAKMGRPLKYNTLEDMEVMLDSYFEDKGNTNKPFTIGGMCLYLDLTYEGLAEYQRRSDFSVTIKKSKMRIEDYNYKQAALGNLHATMTIFNLKNNFGWKDKTEQEITTKTYEIKL